MKRFPTIAAVAALAIAPTLALAGSPEASLRVAQATGTGAEPPELGTGADVESGEAGTGAAVERPEAGLPGEVTAEELQGAPVIGPEGEAIASVNDVLLGADGEIDAVLVDVGGFLGIGAKAVALPLSDLRVTMNPETDEIELRTTMTREALEAAPEHETQEG